METDPDLKDMNLEAISKLVEELQQTTEGIIMFDILFPYTAQPTTKATQKYKQKSQGGCRKAINVERTTKKKKMQTATSKTRVSPVAQKVTSQHEKPTKNEDDQYYKKKANYA